MVVPFTLLLVSPTIYSLRDFDTLLCSMKTPQSSAEATFFRRGSDSSAKRSPLTADPLADAGNDRDHSD